MKKIDSSNKWPATLLAFSMIPLSGFALDVYIPSLPDISSKLHATPAAIQLTLSLFLISLGICQLFIGSILDSYGRHLPTVIGLGVFSVSSFVIGLSASIETIYAMRIIQGLMVATILVSKRAVFIDLYTGEQLKRYTSMFSVIWAAAPVIAPFIGGFLQVHFGWRSNFFFLGGLGLTLLAFELIVGGETLPARQPFHLKSIGNAYLQMVRTKDFTMGLIILGLAYTMIMVYGMTSPFLIERVLHYSPTVTGNAALVSGLSVMAGGMLSRRLIGKPFFKKALSGILFMLLSALLVTAITTRYTSLFTLLAYVITIHMGGGFIFNTVFSYALTRFTHMGGKASGLAGGIYIILTSTVSQGVVSSWPIHTQTGLGFAYTGLILAVLVVFVSTKWLTDHATVKKEEPARGEKTVALAAMAE